MTTKSTNFLVASPTETLRIWLFLKTQDDQNRLVLSSVSELEREVARGHIFLAIDRKTGDLAGCLRCLKVDPEDYDKYAAQFAIPGGLIVPIESSTCSQSTKRLVLDAETPEMYQVHPTNTLLWYASGFIIGRQYRGQRGVASGLVDYAFTAQRKTFEEYLDPTAPAGRPPYNYCILFGSHPRDRVVRPLAARLWLKTTADLFPASRVRIMSWEHARPGDKKTALGNLISCEPGDATAGRLAHAVQRLQGQKSCL